MKKILAILVVLVLCSCSSLCFALDYKQAAENCFTDGIPNGLFATEMDDYTLTMYVSGVVHGAQSMGYNLPDNLRQKGSDIVKRTRDFYKENPDCLLYEIPRVILNNYNKELIRVDWKPVR